MCYHLRIDTRKRRAKRPPKEKLHRVPEHKQLSELEHAKYIKKPHEALARFTNATQTCADWYLVAFRVRFDLFAATERFHGEKEVLVQKGHQLALRILRRFKATESLDDSGWAITAEEYVTLKTVLEAIDWMQIQLERKAVERYNHRTHKEMIRHVN